VRKDRKGKSEIVRMSKLNSPVTYCYQVRLAVWNHTGKLKGFGYVDFKSEESAEIAVNKSVYGGGINVKGRPVICDFETGQAKGSYKPLGSK
jgi:RNA recognition motif-containing protein